MIWATGTRATRLLISRMMRNEFLSGDIPFNVTQPAFQPPPFSAAFNKNVLYTVAFDPDLALPYTLQWNVAVERELGAKQTLTATYLGSRGERLMRGDSVFRRRSRLPAATSPSPRSGTPGTHTTTRFSFSSGAACHTACKRSCLTTWQNPAISVRVTRTAWQRRT